jgi:hypothetical protein
MPLFGEKRPCPNCGAKVKQPADPSEYLCPKCHQPGPWASEGQRTQWAHQQEASTTHRALLQELIEGGDAGTIMPAVEQAASEAGLSGGEQLELRTGAFKARVRSAISDDIVTPEEYERLNTLSTALGVNADSILASGDRALYEQLFVAVVNAGHLPEVASPELMAKKGEVVHLEWPASLLKEVAVRQYQGGSQGFSIPIGKTGIRYRVSGHRGHIVQVGTQLQVADSGTLAVTNKRAVYMGSRKTVDMPFAKLANLTVFSDGIQFNQTNRVNAVMLSITQGSDIVGAVVSAAAQRLEA